VHVQPRIPRGENLLGLQSAIRTGRKVNVDLRGLHLAGDGFGYVLLGRGSVDRGQFLLFHNGDCRAQLRVANGWPGTEQQGGRGGGAMDEAGRAVGNVEHASLHNRLLRLALRAQVDVRDAGIDLLAVILGQNYVSLGQDLVRRSVGAEGDGCLIRRAVAVGVVGFILQEVEQPAVAIELGVMGTNGQGAASHAGIEGHVGGQDDDPGP
jgi:hypothetical protein